MKSLPEVSFATLGAVPYQGLTLLFEGAVQNQQQKVTVLLDTGSSNNFISTSLITAADRATGKKYSVTLADGSTVHNVVEYQFAALVQDCKIETTALAMDLPAGVSVILGMPWMSNNQAVLLTAQKQCNLISVLDNLPYCFKQPVKLRDHPLNSSLRWISASRCSSYWYIKDKFVVYADHTNRRASPKPTTSMTKAMMTPQAALQDRTTTALAMDLPNWSWSQVILGMPWMVQKNQAVLA